MNTENRGTILYVGNFELPDKGASANRVMSNRKLFEELGFRVVLFGVSKTAAQGKICALPEESDLYEIASPRSSLAWLKRMVSVRDIQNVAERYQDLKIIVLYNMPYSLLLSVRRAFRDVKIVYDCTEWGGYTEGNVVKRVIKMLDDRLIRHQLDHRTDGLIVIGSVMKRAYSECENVLILPPLVDTQEKIWHQRGPREEKYFSFCFSGTIGKTKESTGLVMEAFSLLDAKESRLHIVGLTEEDFRLLFPAAVPAFEYCRDRVSFVGRLSHRESVYNVANCDCFVFIREKNLRNDAGFPTKFAEAYTCGVPIITTNVSDVAKYFNNDYPGEVLENPEVPDIRDAMLRVMSAHDSAKVHVRTAFDFREYYAETRLWIEQLLNRGDKQ